MRIGVITDAHLFHKNSQPALYKHTIDKLQNEHKVNCIVDCGDLVDTNVINSVQSKALCDIFSDLHIPMHIIMGNHESMGGVSLASVLGINSNIKIHNDVEVQDGLLFIPYINNITEIKNKLKQLGLKEPVTVAFSHLNLTENFYSLIPFKESKFLHSYAEDIINGHIHTYEEQKTLFGNIYNIGSFSSLTFSDEHLPHYYIYDTEEKCFTEQHPIKGSIIHKTVTVQDADVDFLNELPNGDDVKINWRIKLPIDFDFNKRNEVKQKFLSFSFTSTVQFSYIASAKTKQQVVAEGVTVGKSNSTQMRRLIDKLIDNFESDKNYTLLDEIKSSLKEGGV